MNYPLPDYFNSAVSYVIRNETGLNPKVDGGFTCGPTGSGNDRGGATKWGISQKTLSAWRGANCTIDDVRDLPLEEALKIYREWYWLKNSCNRIVNASVATAIMDMGVLFGPTVSALNAQIALRSSGYPRIVADGIIGPKSLNALNLISFPVWCASFQLQFFNRIQLIVQNDQSQAEYREGWKNRVAKLRAFA